MKKTMALLSVSMLISCQAMESDANSESDLVQVLYCEINSERYEVDQELGNIIDKIDDLSIKEAVKADAIDIENIFGVFEDQEKALNKKEGFSNMFGGTIHKIVPHFILNSMGPKTFLKIKAIHSINDVSPCFSGIETVTEAEFSAEKMGQHVKKLSYFV